MKVAKLVLLALIAIFSAQAAFAQTEPTPLSLDEAIKQALANNHSLASARYDKESGSWATAQAVSGYLPKLYFAQNWQRMDDESVDAANAGYDYMVALGMEAEKAAWKDMYQSSLVFMQPIFNQGREISTILSANASRKERKYNLEDVRLSTIRQTRQAYFSVLTAEESLGASKEAVALAQESLKIAKARFEIGQVNKSETLRWEANLADMQRQFIEAENALEVARIQLANILGAPLTERYILEKLTNDKVDADLAAIAEKTTAEFPTPNSVSSHPSIQKTDQTVSLAKINRFSEIGQMLPSANFQYTYRWENNDTLEMDGDTSWVAGITVEIPLFQSLGGVFGTTKAHKSVRATQSSREQYMRGFLQQLHLAQLTIRSAQKQVNAARKSESYASENLEIVKQRHKLGMTSNLELIDAQFAYTSARANTIRAVGEFYSALADYDYMTSKAQSTEE